MSSSSVHSKCQQRENFSDERKSENWTSSWVCWCMSGWLSCKCKNCFIDFFSPERKSQRTKTNCLSLPLSLSPALATLAVYPHKTITFQFDWKLSASEMMKWKEKRERKKARGKLKNFSKLLLLMLNNYDVYVARTTWNLFFYVFSNIFLGKIISLLMFPLSLSTPLSASHCVAFSRVSSTKGIALHAARFRSHERKFLSIILPTMFSIDSCFH